MKKNVPYVVANLLLVCLLLVCAATARAQGVTNPPKSGCKDLPSHAELKAALTAARNNPDNGGLNFDMWGTIVDRDGVVCAVAFTGTDRGQQWPGSRVISAQKANTANAFSLPNFALSTANLYTAVQPGGSLFGLQESNPVATESGEHLIENDRAGTELELPRPGGVKQALRNTQRSEHP